jgi:hypothetical protein
MVDIVGAARIVAFESAPSSRLRLWANAIILARKPCAPVLIEEDS